MERESESEKGNEEEEEILNLGEVMEAVKESGGNVEDVDEGSGVERNEETGLGEGDSVWRNLADARCEEERITLGIVGGGSGGGDPAGNGTGGADPVGSGAGVEDPVGSGTGEGDPVGGGTGERDRAVGGKEVKGAEAIGGRDPVRTEPVEKDDEAAEGDVEHPSRGNSDRRVAEGTEGEDSQSEENGGGEQDSRGKTRLRGKVVGRREKRRKKRKSPPTPSASPKTKKGGRKTTLHPIPARNNEQMKRRMSTIGSTLGHLAETYKGHFRYHLDAEFTTYGENRVTHTYNFGEELERRSVTIDELVEDALRKREAGQKKTSPQPSTSRGLRTPVKEPASSVVPSPAKCGGPEQEEEELSPCTRKVCTFTRTLKQPITWIGCQWTNPVTEANCKWWAHAKCVGFPHANEGHVASMPLWYCPRHLLNIPI